MIGLKTDSEIALMREANRIVAIILNEVRERIRPGVSTLDLDQWAERRITELDAKPLFKGYGRGRRPGFPGTLCVSINEEVVHGIPSAARLLREGDIVSIDVGTMYKGYCGDGAWTFPVGAITPQAQQLLDCCRQSLEDGVAQAIEGNHLGDVSKAIDRTVRSKGFEIVRELSGHGIGRSLHEEPEILNFYNGQNGPRLKCNMTLSIEPMITAGTWEVRTLPDEWTVVTADGSLAAHFEHTVAIGDDGPQVLTRL
jgi:methionyl aminopeptidase